MRPLALLLVLGVTLPAGAQEARDDRAIATELFHQGRALMAEGKYPEACQLLAESQRLDPGGGTLLNLALCHEAEGKTATAWSELNEALGMARRDERADREQLALERIAALEPKLSRIVIDVPGDAAVPELVVSRNGVPLGRPTWGLAVPADPGTHVIEATAPGRTPWRGTVTLGPDADRQTVTVPLLPLETPPPAPVVPLPTAPIAPAPLPPAPPSARGDESASIWWTGVVLTAAGGAGMLVGAGFGIHAMTLKDEDLAAAGRSADVSTGTWIAGGVLAAAGVVLILYDQLSR